MKYLEDIQYMTEKLKNYSFSEINASDENFYNEMIFQIENMQDLHIRARVMYNNLKFELKERLELDLKNNKITNEEYDKKIDLINIL